MGFEKQLNGEYLDCYKQVVAEIEVENINVFEQEEIKSDILDIFLEAQQETVSVSEIVGNDYKSFVEEIMINIERPNSKVYQIVKMIPLIVGIMGGIGLSQIKNGTINFTIDIFVLIIILMLGDILGRKFSKRTKFAKSRKRRKNIIEWSFNITGIVIGGIISGIINPPVLFVINSPYIFIIGCLILSFIGFVAVDILYKN